jgi:hypothetical protein
MEKSQTQSVLYVLGKIFQGGIQQLFPTKLYEYCNYIQKKIKGSNGLYLHGNLL